jgi:hypothetical protein
MGVDRKGQDAHGSRPRCLRFPPVFTREAFENTDYIASFPDLTGAISTFTGGNREHRALLEDRDAGRPWDRHLSPAGTMLSSACHPYYSTLPSMLSASGELLDIYDYCFRHKPAVDPARMQAFRQHEYVMVGIPEQAQNHRDSWVRFGLEVLNELGLEATATPANDPFFGSAGKMLATKLDENLKTELTVRLYGQLDDGTAVVSSNCHLDHFGSTFGLSTVPAVVDWPANLWLSYQEGARGLGCENDTLVLQRYRADDVCSRRLSEDRPPPDGHFHGRAGGWPVSFLVLDDFVFLPAAI